MYIAHTDQFIQPSAHNALLLLLNCVNCVLSYWNRKGTVFKVLWVRVDITIVLTRLKLKSFVYNVFPRSSQCSCVNINNTHKSTPTHCAAFCSLFVHDAGSGSSAVLKIPGLKTSILKNSEKAVRALRLWQISVL